MVPAVLRFASSAVFAVALLLPLIGVAPVTRAQGAAPAPIAVWDLATDFRTSPLQNPNPDRYGNAGVWEYRWGTAPERRLERPVTDAKGEAGQRGWFRDDADTGGFQEWQFVMLNPAGLVEVHPMTGQPTSVAWRSPISGTVRVSGLAMDIDFGPNFGQCGDGVRWSVTKGSSVLASGEIANGGLPMPFRDGALADVQVAPGDVLALVVDAKGDYSCDSTELALTIEQTAGPPPPGTPPQPVAAPIGVWDLAADFRTPPSQANPAPDRYGNRDVWHYLKSADYHHAPSAYSLLGSFRPFPTAPTAYQWFDGASDGDGAGFPYFAVPVPGIAFMHPDPWQPGVFGWRSPIAGTVRVSGHVVDIDFSCGGNGVIWSVDKGMQTLVDGYTQNSYARGFSVPSVSVQPGDFLYLFIDGYQASHWCDSTQVKFTIEQLTGTPAAPNGAPTAQAGGPYAVDEGGSLALAGDGSDPDGGPLTYAWDFDGDGTFETPGRTPSFSAAGLDGPTSRSVALRACDEQNGCTTASATVTIRNVAPTATFGAMSSVDEGSAIALSLSNPSDPSTADAAAGFRYAFDCGSGYGDFGPSASGSCPTTDNGAPTVKGKVRDKDNDEREYTASVAVNNVAPTVTGITGLTNVLVGVAATFTGSASDPSSADAAAGFTWKWSVDGGPYGSSVTVSACGDHTVTATATDKDGGVSAPSAPKAVRASEMRFLMPLREGTYNSVQKGRVVPVKVSVGCGGVGVTGLAPGIQLLKGDVSPANEAGIQAVDAPTSSADTAGVMRAVEGGYLYNLEVPSDGGATPGALYTIRVRPFGDDTPEAARYIVLQIK